MSFSDGKHNAATIAKLSRQIDETGDFILSIEEVEVLIEIYGKVREAQGESAVEYAPR